MALLSLPILLVAYVAFLLFIFAWRRGNTRGLLLPPGPPPLPIIGNILQVKLWDLPTSLSRVRPPQVWPAAPWVGISALLGFPS